jgi:hypothetical protein
MSGHRERLGRPGVAAPPTPETDNAAAAPISSEPIRSPCLSVKQERRLDFADTPPYRIRPQTARTAPSAARTRCLGYVRTTEPCLGSPSGDRRLSLPRLAFDQAQTPLRDPKSPADAASRPQIPGRRRFATPNPRHTHTQHTHNTHTHNTHTTHTQLGVSEDLCRHDRTGGSCPPTRRRRPGLR